MSGEHDRSGKTGAKALKKKRTNNRRDGGLAIRKINGKVIAMRNPESKEKEQTMNSSTHPIDTLLVQQLESLRLGEEMLYARYSAMDASADTVEVRMAFSKELEELKDRADRLFRLVDSMDYYGQYARMDGLQASAA